MDTREPMAITTSFSDGTICNLFSPDGVQIVFEDDYYLIITPEGYQYKISEYYTEMCGKLDNYHGKEVYEQRKGETNK